MTPTIRILIIVSPLVSSLLKIEAREISSWLLCFFHYWDNSNWALDRQGLWTKCKARALFQWLRSSVPKGMVTYKRSMGHTWWDIWHSVPVVYTYWRQIVWQCHKLFPSISKISQAQMLNYICLYRYALLFKSSLYATLLLWKIDISTCFH